MNTFSLSVVLKNATEMSNCFATAPVKAAIANKMRTENVLTTGDAVSIFG